jgi:MFS family permease
MHHNSLSILRARTRRAVRQFACGGEWAISLPAVVKRNLYWFFFDGLYASASDHIILTYMVLYVLALGATRAQVGLMSSFASLSAALLLLPGALLVERLGRPKQVTVLFGGVLARLAVLALALLPLALGGEALVWAAIGLAVCRDAFGSLAFPAWMSISGEIVPMEGRGRYFGTRNFIMGAAGMVTVFLVGELITRTALPLGYQLALGLAFVLGIVSTINFSRLHVPAGAADGGPAAPPLALREVLADMRGRPVFVALALVMALWNFSLNIAGPFFSVFMVESLGFTASMVGITSIVTSVASLTVQRRIGRLSDRLGPRKVQLIMMLLIPLLPAGWIFITQFWQVVALNAFGGIIWGAFNLVSFNFLLSLIPQAQRARYSAIYQVLVTLALAGGAAFGSLIVTLWGYRAVFLCSAVGRICAAVFFARFVAGRKAQGEVAAGGRRPKRVSTQRRKPRAG